MSASAELTRLPESVPTERERLGPPMSGELSETVAHAQINAPAPSCVVPPASGLRAVLADHRRQDHVDCPGGDGGAEQDPSGPIPPAAMIQLEDAEWARILVSSLEYAGRGERSSLAPVLVSLDATSVSVTLESDARLDIPFSDVQPVQSELGPTWTLPRQVSSFVTVPAVARAFANAVIPCLVSLTKRCDAARRVELIGLAAAGSVLLQGEAAEVDELLRSMVVDAATRRWSDGGRSVLVGFGRELHGLDGVRHVSGIAEAATIAESLVTEGASAAGEDPARSPRHCLTTFFVSHVEDLSALRRLLNSVEAGRRGSDPQDLHNLAAVVVQDVGGCRFVVDASGEATTRCRRASTDEVRGEPDATEDPAGSPTGPRTGSAIPTPAPTLARSDQAACGKVAVNVLGPVQILGAPSPFERRPKLTELIVYLALHPEGSMTDAWSTALWPDRRMPLSTLSNRLSEARLALGMAEDGAYHIRKQGHRHLLGPGVTTDWERFSLLARPGRSAADWHDALELVRGRPFDGLREASWTLLEGIVPTIESAIVDVACRLAEHALAAEDAEEAEWAARRAMLVCPWDERLYRIVMRSADAAGNRAGVDAALRQLARVLEGSGDPLDVVHPETATLYRFLTGRHRRADAAPFQDR